MDMVMDRPIEAPDSESNSERAGIYLLPPLRIEREGWVGSPVLSLDLAINAYDGDVMGRGEISQAIAPPAGTRQIPSVSGKLMPTGFGSGQRLIHVSGSYRIPLGPTIPGQTDARMTAAVVIDREGNGRATFCYGPNAEHSLTDCIVTAD
jgi:hypothetical protein